MDITQVSPADTAFVLICAILVLLMVPGLGFFYAGLDRRNYVLTIIMQSLVSIPITAIIWIFGGFGMAFGPNVGGGIIGDPHQWFLLWNVIYYSGTDTLVVDPTYAAHVPLIAFFIYQLMFAIITPPLMTGAFADRMTWGKYIIFLIVWQYLIYIPVCHWIWGGGFLAQIGVLDWAGGIVVHTTAGFGAIAAVLVLGRRKPLKNGAPYKKSSSVLAMIGIALLWFGWFGFNSGGAMAINGEALRGFINTAIAPCFAMITWMIIEYFAERKKMSAVSVAGAFVAGLAGITPDAGLVPIWAGFAIGFIVAVASYITLSIVKRIRKIDDAMDVFSVHGMTGFVGALLIGAFLLTPEAPSLGSNVVAVPYASSAGIAPDLWHGYQFGVELGAASLVAAWTFVITYILLWVILKVANHVPGTLHDYKSSFEEEKENEDPYDNYAEDLLTQEVHKQKVTKALPQKLENKEETEANKKVVTLEQLAKDYGDDILDPSLHLGGKKTKVIIIENSTN